MTETATALVEGIQLRRVAALARAISLVENQRPPYLEVLAGVPRPPMAAHRIGLTGPPGAGKSTLTDRLIAEYRRRHLTVAVVAVDPTSPISGGALLGDRVRMSHGAGDEGVFIRSMAVRGGSGGLSVTTRDVCDLLESFGFDRIIVETVGIGQSEVAITTAADTSILVLVPESGDDVQVSKAGVTEIADLYVVNKSDRPGAGALVNDLIEMLGIREELSAEQASAGQRVFSTVAVSGDGITELVDAIEQRGEQLLRGDGADARRERQRHHTKGVIERAVRDQLWRSQAVRHLFEQGLVHIEEGSTTPYALANKIIEQLDLGTDGESR